jgi:hypothetical protein
MEMDICDKKNVFNNLTLIAAVQSFIILAPEGNVLIIVIITNPLTK